MIEAAPSPFSANVEDASVGIEALARRCKPEMFEAAGDATPNSPTSATVGTSNLSDDQIVERCFAAANGEKFTKLFVRGDLSDYGGDASRAEAALAAIFAFYTQDAAQIERLMRRSALVRPKWNRADYLPITIRFVLLQPRDRYSPSTSTPNLATLNARREPPPNLSGEPLANGDNGGSVEPISLGEFEGIDLRLIPTGTGNARSVMFDLLFKDRVAGSVTLTPSQNGVRENMRAISDSIEVETGTVLLRGSKARLSAALRKITASESWASITKQARALASARADESTNSRNGPTMIEAFTDQIRARYDPRFVANGDYWCERVGDWRTHSGLGKLADSDTRRAILLARDWPIETLSPCEVNAASMIRRLSDAAVSDLSQSLPGQFGNTGLGPDSNAARAVRAELIDIWANIKDAALTFDRLDSSSGATVEASIHQKTSPVGRVLWAIDYGVGDSDIRGVWHRVMPESGAFFMREDDETIWLAMRADFARRHTMRRRHLSAVLDQRDLSVLLARYGLLAGDNGPTARLYEQGERRRVAVLSRSLCDDILAVEAEADETGSEGARP